MISDKYTQEKELTELITTLEEQQNIIQAELEAARKKLPETPSNLKLFVWENVLREYTTGIVFAYAKNVNHARDLVAQQQGYTTWNEVYKKGRLYRDVSQEPDVYETPVGFAVWGGS